MIVPKDLQPSCPSSRRDHLPILIPIASSLGPSTGTPRLGSTIQGKEVSLFTLKLERLLCPFAGLLHCLSPISAASCWIGGHVHAHPCVALIDGLSLSSRRFAMIDDGLGFQLCALAAGAWAAP